MLSLDDMVVKQKELVNKGYELDNIKVAALLLIAERVGVVSEQLDVLLSPTITHEPAELPKIGPLPVTDPVKFADKIGIPPERQERINESTEDMIARELEETDGDN